MAAVQECRQIYQLKTNGLSKKEIYLLEAELLLKMCDELIKIIKIENQGFLQLLKFESKKEDIVVEENFIRCLINDLLASGEYSLAGIAYYTETPEDIIYEIASGHNLRPTFALAKKIIELHRIVRKELYNVIIHKVLQQNFLQSYHFNESIS